MNTNGHTGANGRTKPLNWFVDSLMQSTGQIELIVQHMLQFDAETGVEPETSIDETLRELLTDVLGNGLDRDPEEYAAAAALLADVRKAIEDGVYLVRPGAFDDELIDPELDGPPV